LSSDKRVGLFCQGGHGRTGYVASVVLGKLGYEDPIQFLRSRYCRRAVETDAQIRHIAAVLGKPGLISKHEVEVCSSFEELLIYYHGYESLPGFSENLTCGECANFMAGKCQTLDIARRKSDIACYDFVMR
jgi:hypothetical protein